MVRRSSTRKAASKRRSGKRTKAAKGKNRTSVERTREMAPIALASCLAAAVLVGLAIVPVRTWLSQQQKMKDAETDIARIEGEVAELQDELYRLETDDEIERRARRDFDLVYPGEESYRILPPPTPNP
jgi:cell division protein FtsB